MATMAGEKRRRNQSLSVKCVLPGRWTTRWTLSASAEVPSVLMDRTLRPALVLTLQKEMRCAQHRRLENFLRDPIPVSFLCPVCGILLASMGPTGFLSEQEVCLPAERSASPRLSEKLSGSWKNVSGPEGGRVIPRLFPLPLPAREVPTFFQEVPRKESAQ